MAAGGHAAALPWAEGSVSQQDVVVQGKVGERMGEGRE